MNKIQETFTLYNDEIVKEKLTVMGKWEAMMDDSRNDLTQKFTEENLNKFLKLGNKYRLTIEVIND